MLRHHLQMGELRSSISRCVSAAEHYLSSREQMGQTVTYMIREPLWLHPVGYFIVHNHCCSKEIIDASSFIIFWCKNYYNNIYNNELCHLFFCMVLKNETCILFTALKRSLMNNHFPLLVRLCGEHLWNTTLKRWAKTMCWRMKMLSSWWRSKRSLESLHGLNIKKCSVQLLGKSPNISIRASVLCGSQFFFALI